MTYFPTDPIVLGAQARDMLTKLHQRSDIVVHFKTNESGYDADKLTEIEQKSVDGGHYSDTTKIISIALDKVLAGRDGPSSLSKIEDFRLYPVLAGVAAHESGNARWSRWHDTADNPFPAVIPNPDFDPAHPVKMLPNPDYGTSTGNKEADDLSLLLPKEIEDPSYAGPESFPVSEADGKLVELAKVIEEPRVERLARTNLTKTWKKALEFSATHLTLQTVDNLEDDDTDPLDNAVRLAALVGGRMTAGTLGVTPESRAAAQKVLESARRVIESAGLDTPDPFEKIMGIVNAEVFNNEHEDALPHLEAARKILAIIHPEDQENPDKGGDGSGDASSESQGMTSGGAGGESNKGEGKGGLTEEQAQALAEAIAEAASELESAVAKMGGTGEKEAKKEADQEKQRQEGYGTVDEAPRNPVIAYYDEPNAEDREIYKRAQKWMRDQTQPTITYSEYGQWMPGGGAKLNVRQFIRDNLANLHGTRRTDWDQVSETVKPAPPVKVAVMLDGSASMSIQARFSAGVAWAVANAAADLPESRQVSIVFGNSALVTQEPGNGVQARVAVPKTDGTTENFVDAAALVEEHLRLDPMANSIDNPDAEPENVLIIIISDLMFFGGIRAGRGMTQATAAAKTSREWVDRGYRVINIGCDAEKFMRNPDYAAVLKRVLSTNAIELTTKENLFK